MRSSFSGSLAKFNQFLMSEYSEENLEFWMSVEQYKCLDSPLERQQKAKQIYETFVSECSMKQVNMEARLHSHIKNNLTHYSK